MLPTWMIEEIEKRRREREMERSPRLQVEVEIPAPEQAPARDEERPPTVVVIEL